MTVKILIGDCREVMKTLPDESVHTVVTSPPYWGLRDYGIDKQIGMEDSYLGFVNEMVSVFREVHRVLRKDGTVWLNLGDSYNSPQPGPNPGGFQGKAMRKNEDYNKAYPRKSRTKSSTTIQSTNRAGDIEGPNRTKQIGLKPKDLVGIPWRVALALQADGWYLRQDIIWHKPAPMVESVKDRCTKAHEYIFLLSKNYKYYYDQDAIREPHQDKNGTERFVNGCGIGERHPNQGWYGGKVSLDKHRNYNPLGRNKRSVWSVHTRGFKGAHFATFPPELIKPCILAGCPEGGTVLDPFGGTGTTGLVAQQLKRNAILIELNPKYVEIMRKRLAQNSIVGEDNEMDSSSLREFI